MVNLTMDENQKYITIKKLVETHVSNELASISLNCTIRHINRIIKGNKEKGKEYFVHSNRGKKLTDSSCLNVYRI